MRVSLAGPEAAARRQQQAEQEEGLPWNRGVHTNASCTITGAEPVQHRPGRLRKSPTRPSRLLRLARPSSTSTSDPETPAPVRNVKYFVETVDLIRRSNIAILDLTFGMGGMSMFEDNDLSRSAHRLRSALGEDQRARRGFRRLLARRRAVPFSEKLVQYRDRSARNRDLHVDIKAGGRGLRPPSIHHRRAHLHLRTFVRRSGLVPVLPRRPPLDPRHRQHHEGHRRQAPSGSLWSGFGLCAHGDAHGRAGRPCWAATYGWASRTTSG